MPQEILIPAELRKKLSPRRLREIFQMDHRRRFQALRLAQGLCVLCGKEPLAGKRYGERCLAKARERMRRKLGVKRPVGPQLSRLRK